MKGVRCVFLLFSDAGYQSVLVPIWAADRARVKPASVGVHVNPESIARFHRRLLPGSADPVRRGGKFPVPKDEKALSFRVSRGRHVCEQEAVAREARFGWRFLGCFWVLWLAFLDAPRSLVSGQQEAHAAL